MSDTRRVPPPRVLRMIRQVCREIEAALLADPFDEDRTAWQDTFRRDALRTRGFSDWEAAHLVELRRAVEQRELTP